MKSTRRFKVAKFAFNAVALNLILFASTCDAQQSHAWTNWMGGNIDGVSLEAGWSTDWPDEGLPHAWEAEIGIGFSSMAIANGRLFTMGYKGDQRDGTETVYCLNSETGEELWTHSYPSQLVDNLYEGGPGSTPTIDGDHVYTLGKEGQLFCFRVHDGQIVWQRKLQQDLDVSLPEWGFNSSPRILGDQLILEAGRVASYDKQTGKINWQTSKHIAGYGSAALLEQDGKQFLATLDCEGFKITAAEDGTEVDGYPWPSPFQTNSTTPIVHGNTIFVSTGYQMGCGLFRFSNRRLDLIYDNRDMRNHFNNSILWDGYLYGFDGNSNLGRVVHLVCMNHETGEVAWKHRGLGCGSLMIADGKLVILSDDGRLVIAKANPREFVELASTQILEGRCWTVPVLLNSHVYARNARGNLVCVKLPPSE